MRMIQALLAISVVLYSSAAVSAADIDWRLVRTLQGKALLEYVASLDLKGQAALNFWKNIPVSKANQQVFRIFREEAFAIYMNKYPRPFGRGVEFKAGMGTDIVGSISNQKLRLPFSGVHPLPEGRIGDPGKHYTIAYTIHGLTHPWLLNNADSAKWQAGRHPNVSLTVLDPEFDNDKQAKQIDELTGQKVDGILVWPMQERRPAHLSTGPTRPVSPASRSTEWSGRGMSGHRSPAISRPTARNRGFTCCTGCSRKAARSRERS